MGSEASPLVTDRIGVSRPTLPGATIPAHYVWHNLRSLAPAAGLVSLSSISALTLGMAVTVDAHHAILASTIVVFVLVPRSWLLVAAIILTRFDIPYSTGSLQAHDVAILFWLARSTIGGNVRLQIAPADLPLVGFAGCAWVSTIVHGGSATPLIRVSLYIAICVLLSTDRQARSTLMNAIVAYALIELLLTLPQLLRVVAGDRTAIQLLGATLQDPHLFGFLLLAALSHILWGEVSVPRPAVVTLLLTLGIILTMRRTVWLGLLIVLALHNVRRISLLRALIVAGALGIFSLFVYGPLTSIFELAPNSAELRVTSNAAGLGSAFESPLLGRGWSVTSDLTTPMIGSSGTIIKPYAGGYSAFVFVIAATGFFGGGLFIAWLALRGRLIGLYDHSLLAWLITFLVFSLASQTIYAASPLTLMFFIFMGVSKQRPICAVAKPYRFMPPRNRDRQRTVWRDA